uniref:Tox-SGS domain-containing protein n=1 Tax=Anopheles quadriannulatus TaxID=34691 RepID=A0A182XLU3_ANOQN
MDAPKQFYSLQLPGKSLTKAPPGNTVEVKRAPSTEQIIFVRNNRALLIYERMGGSWSEVHKRNNFFAVSNDDASYPWAVYDDGLLAVRKVKGFVLYRWNKKELNELLVAAKYHDEYGYALSNNTILFGNIYPSAEYIGVISRLHSVVEFSSAKPSDPRKRVRPLKKQLDLEAAWMQPSSTISLVERYDNNAQLSIALRTAAELKLFRFDNQYQLKELATVKDFLPLDDEYDRIMFAKFDDANINDLLHFTTKGLTMYRFFEESGVFEKVYYSTAFSKLRGWNRRTIESIATVNIDGDKWDELIASGPRGLCLYRPVFGNDGFELVNIFDETIEDGEMRYGIPKLTTKLADSDGFNVLLFTGANLVSVQTRPYIPMIYDVPSAAQTVVKANAVAPLLVPQKKYIVWLHDQLDLNSMLQPLNPHAGTVELSIPLIELPNAFGVSVRKYVQYKNIPFESFFGRGWSLPLDYISVERKNSAFLQDHDYAVLKNNNRIILKRYPHLDSVDCWSFEIDGFKQATIKYYPSKERWEMTMEDRTFVYGAWENLSKRREEDVCASWPLCGEKSANERKLPSRWYLVHEESKYGAYANYYYDPLVEGKGDRLARIELSSGSSVSFKYSEQNKLVNFKVNTTCYEQNVSFEYEGNWLKQINQDDRPLFKFDYKDDRMWKIVYPNRLESMMEYSDVQIDRTRFEEAVPVDLNPTIYYGPDYTVILDKEFEDDRVAITIRNLLGGTDGPKAMKEKLHFGQPGIKSHTIHALEDMLVVVLIYGSQKEVTVLQFTGKDWVEKEYISDFPLDAVISVGKKFVVLCDLKTLRVLTINHKGNLNDTEVQKSLPPKFLIHTFGNGFLMCSASSIDVWTMGIKNEWQKGSTQAPTNIFTDIDKLLNAFVLDAEFSTALRKGFLADAVTVYQNAIVIRVPVLDGQKLNLKVFFLIMNYDRGATQVSKQTVQIPIANFDTYEYDMPTKDGDVFKLHYKVQNNKYVLKLKSMKGPLNNSLTEQKQKSYKQIEASGEAAAKKAQYKKEVDEKFAEEVDNISQTVVSKAQFAMDLSQFGVLTNQHGVVTGNVQLSFDGQTWQQQPIDPATMRMEKVDQPLGAGFKLAKYSYQDTFKVYEMPRHAVVYDTQTNNPQEIQVVAPRYIQSQPAGKRLSMFFFHTKETIQQPANVTMVRASNTISLVTVRHVNETSKFVLFRPVDSFLLKMTSLFTKQRVRLDQEELRISSYNYHPRDVHLSSEGAMFYRVKVAPGDNERRFGWYEQATNSSTGATTKKSFAADGTDVTVREKPKQESNRDAEVKDLERTIWDRSKQLKIVDLGALKLADEVASYYGFETYELNRYGVDKEWSFNVADVQFERDNHYLKLPASSTLKATFTPTEPKNLWIVSFWVRIGNGEMVPKVDDMLNVLKVELENLNNKERVQLTVRVREIIYDEIDRPIMQTKWTKLTSHLKEYFAFYENFITQVHGTSHVMSGMVAKAHPSCEGFPYSRTIYANDPTENKQYQGLPGKEYTVLGKYKRRYAMRPEIKVLANIFPVAEGYRQSIVERPGGAIRATVEDKRGNKVAKYWQFHALAKTTSRTRPFLTGGNTQEEIKLRNLWRVSYEYDYGNLIGKRTPDGGTYEYIYNGMVETMNVRTDPTHTFQRNFTYNEPGFLIKLADNYLTESVSYLETDSYGQDSYTPIYEGLISKTLFTAHWQKATSPLRNGIYTEYLMSDNMNRAQASLCLEVLKRTGYIDENNLVNRTLYGDMNDDLPFVCGKRLALNHLSKVLSTRSFPYQYGHRYDYDDHDQLIKAKYFHGLEELKLAPLTHHTFHKEIKGIDEAKSKKIWDALRDKSFLTTDCTNPSLCHGREGTKSIFNDFIHQHRYSHHLKLMLSKAISARKGLDVKTFEEKCTRWIEGSNMILKACTNLKEEMMKQKLFGESADAPVASLSEGFRKALQRYKSNVPDIVGVLNNHFMTALGRSAGDVQSYEIDANGNHRKFYTGFSRYRLEYQEGTNKITKLYRQQFDRAQGGREEFTMAHDGDGAVIQAEHKGIKHMAYDKLLQRVSEIEMTDGRKILYQYDVRAERTFKQVRGKDGKVMSEKYYIRDANGLVLMDMDMSYLASDQPPDVRVTSYIYKDQQLIGFVRNDKLYGVITDHEGSGGEFDMTKWDYSDPALYMSFVDGFTTATVGVLFLRNLPRQISKWSGKNSELTVGIDQRDWRISGIQIRTGVLFLRVQLQETPQFWVIQTSMEIVQICLFVPFLSSEA